MLKIKKEHFYGSQENYDLQLVRMKLDTENLDEKEALENGWLIAYDEWYPCRSVRINIRKYLSETKVPNLPKTIVYSLVHNTQMDKELRLKIKEIAEEFSKLKGFEWEYDIFSDFDRSIWLCVHDDNQLVAVTKMIKYVGGIESQFTVWNYHNPKLSLGKKIVYFEIDAASGVLDTKDYLYIGQGYERGSVYKTSFAGFEWWTGEEWSTDRAEYERLCHRDSSINTLKELARVYKGKD